MAQRPWYRGVPAVEAELEVRDGATHRIVWRRGRLVLADHPDPAGEQALVALGAESCPCFDVLEAWREAKEPTAWPTVYTWSYHAAEALREYRAQRERLRSLRRPGPTFGRVTQVRQPSRPRPTAWRSAGGGWLAYSTGGGAGMPSVTPPIMSSWPAGALAEFQARMREQLFGALPSELLERLAYGMVVKTLRAGEQVSGMALIRLREFVVEALGRSVRAWGPTRRSPTVDVNLWLSEGSEPQVVGLVEPHMGYVEAVLPSRWLVAVYARGLAVVDDCFVLDATLDQADAGTAQTVHFERTGSAGWTPIQQERGLHRSRTNPPAWHLS